MVENVTMEASNIERLKFEQQKAIGETNERIALLDKYKEDYKILKDRFKTLPDKVTHDVMVPFGKLAFMPGQLVHTNEVMVLLGDNWFAERSAKQASSLIDRRIQTIDKQIEDLRKQLDLLTPRLNFTSDMKDAVESNKGVVDINEEYDPVKEKKWREQHKRNVRVAKQKEAARRMEAVSPEGVRTEVGSEDVLWQRLEELERQEEERNELNRSGSENDDEPGGATFGMTAKGMESSTERNATTRHGGKQVQWKDLASSNHSSETGGSNITQVYGIDGNDDTDDDEDDDDDDDDGDDDDDDEEDEETLEESCNPRRQRTINFHHTSEDHEKPSSVSASATLGTITSPADLYRQFVDVPKSILKPRRDIPGPETTSPSTSGERVVLKPQRAAPGPETTSKSASRERVILPGSQSAFSGEIVERLGGGVVLPTTDSSQPGAVTPDISHRTENQTENQTTDSKGAQVPRKVSKFKARRMQQNQ